MGKVADLLVRIGADWEPARKELNALQRHLRTAFGSKGLEISSKALTSIIGAGAALAGLAAYAVKAGGELTQVETAMKNLLGSTEKAESMISDLQKFAAATPFEFSDVTQATQKFLAFGFTAEQVIPSLTAIGDAAAGVGAGTEGVNRLILAVGQIGAKGKLAAEEMRQISELGIPAWRLLADYLNTDIATAQDMVTKRAVDSQTALKALVGGMEQVYGGMMEAQSQTILGAWARLQDGIGQAAAQTGKVIAEELNIKEILSDVGGFLSDFAQSVRSSGIREAIQDLVPVEVQLAIVSLAGVITAAAIPALYGMCIAAKLALAPIIPAVTAAIAAFWPIVAAVVAAGAALYGLWASGVTVSEMLDVLCVNTDLLSKAWEALKHLGASVADLLGNAFVALAPIIGAVFAGICAAIGLVINILSILVTVVGEIVSAIVRGFSWLAEKIGEIIGGVVNLFSDMANRSMPDWAKNCISAISSMVQKASAWLGRLRNEVADTNDALRNVKGDGTSKKESSVPKYATPDFAQFAGTGGGAAGGKKNRAAEKELRDAENISKKIEKRWYETFQTKSAMVDRWYKEESKSLEKSKASNENYERDKTRLAELYAQKRIEALVDEQNRKREILNSARNISFDQREAQISLNPDAGQRGLDTLILDTEKTVSAIIDKYTKMETAFVGMVEREKEEYLKALDEMGVAYQLSQEGEISFADARNKEIEAARKKSEDKQLAYHAQNQDIKARIDEAYQQNSLAKLREALTAENAERLASMRTTQAIMKRLEENTIELAKSMKDRLGEAVLDMQSGFQTFFQDIFTGTKSVGEAFKNLANSIQNAIFGMMAKMFASKLISSIFGGLGFFSDGGYVEFSTGGLVRSYAPGGSVFGPGTSTSDSIPAFLSNGEYVLNAAAVSRVGLPFLDAINEGRAAGFSTGGYVGDAASLFKSANGGGVNVVINLTNASGQEMKAEQTGSSFDGENYVVSVVMKAIGNNTNGIRSILKGVATT